MNNKLLTKEIAERYIEAAKKEECYVEDLLQADNLSFQEIENAAAKVIADYYWDMGHNHLSLDLTSITESAAKHLSLTPELTLSGISEISESVLKSLLEPHDAWQECAWTIDRTIEFPDLEISEPQAEIFSRSTGCKKVLLSCDKEISESSIKYLSLFKGLVCFHVFFNGPERAKMLGDMPGAMSELSDTFAETLSKFKGTLELIGLEDISKKAAESLSQHQGYLALNNLKKLNKSQAESLSKHQGELSLNGLKTLSDPAAESLSKLQGNLSLTGLKSLSDPAAKSLSKHQGNLDLMNGKFPLFSDAAAESLSKHQGKISNLNPKEFVNCFR